MPFFSVLKGLVKTIAVVLGGALTLLSVMALLGRVTDNGWIRFLGGLVLTVGIPAFLVDRVLPKDDMTRVPGLASDVLAVALLGFPLVFVGVLHGSTRKMLLAEADRIESAGYHGVARAAYAIAGVDAQESSAETNAGPVEPTPTADAGVEDAGSVAKTEDASAKTEKEEPAMTPAELFKKWSPSVVAITTKEAGGESGGTGFVIDDKGTIATNRHVIDGAIAVRVKLQDGKWSDDTELLAEDEKNDVALISVKPAPTVTPVVLGDSENVTVGEHILTIGNPLGLEHTLTDGLVSSRRLFDGRPMIQMSVPVSPGNSGGPVFDMHGHVVGIATLQVGGGLFGRAQNLNMAAPINQLKNIVRPPYAERRKFGSASVKPQTW